MSAGQIAGLEEKEATAVEAEDFEAAATLSADLDNLKAQAAHVQAQIRNADAACDHAVYVLEYLSAAYEPQVVPRPQMAGGQPQCWHLSAGSCHHSCRAYAGGT